MTDTNTSDTAQNQEQNYNFVQADTNATQDEGGNSSFEQHDTGSPEVVQQQEQGPSFGQDNTNVTQDEGGNSSFEQHDAGLLEEADAAVPMAQVAEQESEPVNDQQKILIVEDERPLAHALELKLNHSGMKAVSVNNGNDALAQLENTKFDIILLDLILPGMDGFELLKAIRERNTESKIVILSNLGQSEDRERIERYDVSDYYVKSNMPLAAVVQSIQSLA